MPGPAALLQPLQSHNVGMDIPGQTVQHSAGTTHSDGARADGPVSVLPSLGDPPRGDYGVDESLEALGDLRQRLGLPPRALAPWRLT